MTNLEKANLAAQRELVELGKLVKTFDTILADMVSVTAQMYAASFRMRSVNIDAQIDNLDRLVAKYADDRRRAPVTETLSKNLADIARPEATVVPLFGDVQFPSLRRVDPS